MAPPVIRRFLPGDRVYVRAQQVWIVLVAFVMWRHKHGKRTLTYGELAEQMGLDTRASIGLGRELGIVGNYCALNGLPTLNSIVVNSQTGLPGSGVVVRDSKSYKQEQAETLKENWFAIRVPTTGTLRQVWEESRETIHE